MEAELRVFIPEWLALYDAEHETTRAEEVIRKVLEGAGFAVLEYEPI